MRCMVEYYPKLQSAVYVHYVSTTDTVICSRLQFHIIKYLDCTPRSKRHITQQSKKFGVCIHGTLRINTSFSI